MKFLILTIVITVAIYSCINNEPTKVNYNTTNSAISSKEDVKKLLIKKVLTHDFDNLIAEDIEFGSEGKGRIDFYNNWIVPPTSYFADSMDTYYFLYHLSMEGCLIDDSTYITECIVPQDTVLDEHLYYVMKDAIIYKQPNILSEINKKVLKGTFIETGFSDDNFIPDSMASNEIYATFQPIIPEYWHIVTEKGKNIGYIQASNVNQLLQEFLIFKKRHNDWKLVQVWTAE